MVNIDDFYLDIKRIKKLRKDIYAKVVSKGINPDIDLIKETKDLDTILQLYDKKFLGSFFKKNNIVVDLRFNNRLRRSAGQVFLRSKRKYTIEFSDKVLYRSFECKGDKYYVEGILCRNRLEALLRVLEHEIIHILEFWFFGTSDCSKDRFLEIAMNIFGHESTVHNLVCYDVINRIK